MKRNKKTVLALAALIGGVCIGTGGITYALLQTSVPWVENAFSGTIVNVAVKEQGGSFETGENDGFLKLETGKSQKKVVQIENKNSDVNGNELATTNTYVRVRLVPIFRDESGGAMPVDVSKVSYTFGASDKWEAKEVGGETYYYYNVAIAPGAVTDALITAVSYDREIPDGATFELQVLTEGVAAAQQRNYESAWEDKL